MSEFKPTHYLPVMVDEEAKAKNKGYVVTTLMDIAADFEVHPSILIPVEKWQPIATAPEHEEVWFWIVPKTKEETYHNTSGDPILAYGEGYARVCKYMQWGALWKATHWQPKPTPPVICKTNYNWNPSKPEESKEICPQCGHTKGNHAGLI